MTDWKPVLGDVGFLHSVGSGTRGTRIIPVRVTKILKTRINVITPEWEIVWVSARDLTKHSGGTWGHTTWLIPATAENVDKWRAWSNTNRRRRVVIRMNELLTQWAETPTPDLHDQIVVTFTTAQQLDSDVDRQPTFPTVEGAKS